LQKYQKKKARVSHQFFAMNLEKDISTPENQLFFRKPNKKKKNMQSYTPCLNSQSVKNIDNTELRVNNVILSFFIFNGKMEKH